MENRRVRWNENRGFTLVELLITMVIASLVGMAAYTVFQTSSRSTVAQENVSEAQQNVRVAMDRLAKDIRTAGFGLPDTPVSLDFAGTAFSAPITITNGGTDNPDTITVLGIGYEAGTLNSSGVTDPGECNGSGDSKICLDSVTSTNRFFNSADPPEFQSVRKYISVDGIKYIELATTGHDRENRKLALGSPDTLDRDFVNGTRVYIIQAVTYSIAIDLTGCTTTNPCLTSRDFTMLRGGGRQVLADGIEDIQFAYSLDGSPTFVNGDSSSTDIVAVQASIVGKTRFPDVTGSGSFFRPAAEDHTAGPVDGYRRRVLKSVIKIRNPRNGS